jgi:hypothetical protein
VLNGAKENMKAIGKSNEYFSGKKLSADANYHKKKFKRSDEEKNNKVF